MKEPWEKELAKHEGGGDNYAEGSRLLTEVQKSLIAAAIGSCTCLTKSPSLVYHTADCRYLKIASALESLDGLQNIVADVRNRCANIALEERCQRGTPWDLACVTIAEKIRGHQPVCKDPSPCPCVPEGVLCPDCQVYGGVNRKSP